MHDRSNSASRSRITNKTNNNIQGGGGLLASPYSPESIMTRNPI